MGGRHKPELELDQKRGPEHKGRGASGRGFRASLLTKLPKESTQALCVESSCLKVLFWDRKREKKRKTPASVSACALGMEQWLFFLKIRTENEGGGLV